VLYDGNGGYYSWTEPDAGPKYPYVWTFDNSWEDAYGYDLGAKITNAQMHVESAGQRALLNRLWEIWREWDRVYDSRVQAIADTGQYSIPLKQAHSRLLFIIQKICEDLSRLDRLIAACRQTGVHHKYELKVYRIAEDKMRHMLQRAWTQYHVPRVF